MNFIFWVIIFAIFLSFAVPFFFTINNFRLNKKLLRKMASYEPTAREKFYLSPTDGKVLKVKYYVSCTKHRCLFNT